MSNFGMAIGLTVSFSAGFPASFVTAAVDVDELEPLMTGFGVGALA